MVLSITLLIAGLAISGITLIAIVLSIANPEKRLWPPHHYTRITPMIVWIPTFTLALILICLGILGWGTLPLPTWLRYGIGIPVIVLSNAAVWYEALQFGMAQTGGAKGTLRTTGFYRYSRNPQYVADSMMVAGWSILSAAPLTMVLGALAIIVLIAAPFAEEPWLRQQYGTDYERYFLKVRRFF